MIELTPTGRLEWLIVQPFLAHAGVSIERLLAKYEEFLDATNAEESELIHQFLDPQTAVNIWRQHPSSAISCSRRCRR
jgi:hypothetical protein